MVHGIRKGLEDVAWELKGIRNILASMWHSRYENGETDVLNPEAYADEYISTEECARRLNVSDQTLRNWMAIGRKTQCLSQSFQEGSHSHPLEQLGAFFCQEQGHGCYGSSKK